MGRAVLRMSLVAACIAVATPATAQAQTVIHAEDTAYAPNYRSPTFTAGVAKAFSGSLVSTAYGAGTDDPGATITRAVVRWGDGTSSPASVTEPPVDKAGPINITGSHTYSSSGTFLGAVDVDQHYDAKDDDPPFDLHIIGQAGGVLGFTVKVDDGGSGSCPVADPPALRVSTGRTTSFVQLRRQSCPYNTLFGSDEKFLFRKLAKIAYDGYVVDKAIDDFISKWTGEDWVTKKIVREGKIFEEFVAGQYYGEYVLDKALKRLPKKLGGLGWILDTPKYASWLDYVKYAALTRLADDPPDPKFNALASPPKLHLLRGAPSQVGERDRREAGLYIALLTTVERAAGAEAAGASTAQGAQLRHASGIARKLASVLAAEQKALRAAAGKVKRIRAGRLPRGVLHRVKRRLSAGSFTPSLRKLGFTKGEIAAVGKSAPSAPTKGLTAPFQQVLGLSAEAKTVGAERAALADFAKRYAQGG